MKKDKRLEAPEISPLLQDNAKRPLWSVMIPTYNPRPEHFEQALRSVLAQDPGPERMQIEVVDDCSTDVDVAALVKRIGGERITFSRNSENLGLAGGWNSCVERANGVWVHILHQDDYVSPGFYDRLDKAARSHPEVSLIAVRCFLVDEHGIIKDMTGRLPGLENGGKDVSDYLYTNPFRCPGVVVRRAFYESYGGFRADLTFALDWEMWLRAISLSGGVALPEVLASNRIFYGTESTRLAQNVETLNDRRRLDIILAERYPSFDAKKSNRHTCSDALSAATLFAQLGDQRAALANLSYYRRNASMRLKFRHFIARIARRVARAL